MDPKNLKYTLYEKDGNIARITLNNPDKLNALNMLGETEETTEMYNCLKAAALDDDIKVIVFSGKGRALSVGHHLTKVGFVYGFTTKSDDRKPSQRIRLDLDKWAFHDRMMEIMLHPKVTIVQCHGYCYGAGMMFPLLMDLAIAAEDAQFGSVEQRMGFAGSGVPYITHLIYAVGLKRALDLLLTGKTISGKEAAEIGLVNKAVPIDKLDEEVNKLAKAISLLPRDGIAIGKANRHIIYDRIGLLSGAVPGYISHTMFTNLRWEDDEYNFFKERRDKGAKAGFHKRDERFQGLV